MTSSLATCTQAQTSLETFLYLVESSVSNNLDYTQNIQRGVITPAMREELCNWIFDLCVDYNTSSKTPQLACNLVDSFLSKKRINSPSVLSLVGAIALHIALKLEGDYSFTPQEIQKLCGGKFSLGVIQSTELFMLSILEWKLSKPTASEIMNFMLSAFCPEFDFSFLIKRAEAISALCYADCELSQNSPLVIAVASASHVLDKLNHTEFKRDLYSCVENVVRLDHSQINDCMLGIYHKVLLMRKTYSKDSISTASSE
jgi:hypothetical protein